MTRHVLLLVSALLVAGGSAPARAEEPGSAAAGAPALGPLLVKLGEHGARIEEMKKRGSYTLSGHVERLDGDGEIDSWKDLVLRVTATGDPTPKSEIVKYVEDGEDKTAEAKEKALGRSAKKKVDKKREFKVPFLPSEQPKYDFRVLGRDTRYPGRVKLGFQAKKPDEDTWNGTAWVNEADGEVESLGLSFSKLPAFVDQADATLVFGNRTPLGRAPSEMQFEAKGGFLFVHRHYRGHARLTDATLAAPSTPRSTPPK